MISHGAKMYLPALFGSVLIACTGCGGGNSASSSPAWLTAKIEETIAKRPPTSSPLSGDESQMRASLERPRPETVIRAVEDWTMPQAASYALGRIGAAATPELARLLRSSDPAIRRQAAETLSRIGPGAAEAVPALAIALRDDDRSVRRMAARALGQIGPAAQLAVPDLISALQEPATH